MDNTKQHEASAEAVDPRYPDTPIGIVRSRDAFLRDLPALLANPKYDRWSVAYVGDERIGIAESEIELVRECKRRGLRRDQYFIGIIFPFGEDDEEVEGALSFVEYDDDDGTFSGPALDKGHPSP
jgi:hypothetical protein